MSAGVNSRLLADRTMAIADSNQVCLLKWIPLEFPEASSVSAYLPFLGNLYAQNRLFHAILGAAIYFPGSYRSWQPSNLITATPLMTDNWSVFFLFLFQDVGDTTEAGESNLLSMFSKMRETDKRWRLGLSSCHHYNHLVITTFIIPPTASHGIPPAECWCSVECF